MRDFVGRSGATAALAVIAVAWSAGAALAENLALVIGNSRYQNTVNAKDAERVLDLGEALTEAGYRVQKAQNATRDDLRAILANFGDDAAEADRLIVIFAGHVLTSGTETFLTPTDLKDPKPITIALQAPSLSSLLAIMADHAGGAAVFLGFHDGEGGFFGGEAGFRGVDGLTPGLGPVTVPQGVLLASGPPAKLTEALKSGFLATGATTARVVGDLDEEIEVAGYISRFSTLAPGREVMEEPPAGDADAREQAYWRIAETQNTIAGYEDFLSRYPSGAYAEMARLKIKEMQAAEAQPQVSAAEQAEIDLGLSREDRKQVQRDLTILEHDPRGVDGLFGPATRRAIGSWQQANRFTATGFLDSRQLELLRDQAQVRGEQLAEEARRKAEEQRQADIRFWNQTGRSGQEADLRVYLRNYPDGIYAEEARRQLDAIERARIEQSRGPERTAWQRAEALGTEDAYEEYLRRYPNGLFAETAQERIEALRQDAKDRDRLEEAQREEDRLGLNTQAWLLIERRLSQQGLDPGRVDGTPTDMTRKAIRRYQSSAGLPVTGYMDRRTLSRLILVIKF